MPSRECDKPLNPPSLARVTSPLGRGVGVVFACVLALATLQGAQAKTPDEVRQACRQEGRPCIGLVLSGGGARGFAHIGVLKEIERLKIPVDVVTGTSMGAMVGGAWAAGLSAEQIEAITAKINWAQVLSPSPLRTDQPMAIKAQDDLNLLHTKIRFNEAGFSLPRAVVGNQEIMLFLHQALGFTEGITDLETLPIPFGCVATNLVTGNPVILQKNVTLPEALRASMSVPGAFDPIARDGTLLVDGGLVDNLPVELARRMGADMVIAVNVGSPMLTNDEIQSALSVLTQMVNLLTEKNVNASLASLTERDILITPDLGSFTSIDFDQLRPLVQDGVASIPLHEAQLARLSVNEDAYASYLAARTRLVPKTSDAQVKIAAMEVKGVSPVRQAAIEKTLYRYAPTPFEEKDIDNVIRELYAQGNTSAISYRLRHGKGDHADSPSVVLEVLPQEKPERFNTLRFGAGFTTDLHSQALYQLSLLHEMGLVNAYGAHWLNSVTVGTTLALSSQFFQPITPGSAWQVVPALEMRLDARDVFTSQQKNPVGRVLTGSERMHIGLLYNPTPYWEAGVKVGVEHFHEKTLMGDISREDTRGTGLYAEAGVKGDTLDNEAFPREGVAWGARVGWHAHHASRRPWSYRVEARFVKSMGPYTAQLALWSEKAPTPYSVVLGGVLALPGTPLDRYQGERGHYARVMVGREMGDVLDLYGQHFWLGAMAAAGQVAGLKDQDPQDHRLKKSVGLWLGWDSVLGPLFLTAGRTLGVGNGVYLYWGRVY